MPLNFFSTSSHALNHGVKVCAHGKSGAGKTTLIATAPKPFVLSAESGTLSIAKQNIPGLLIGNMTDLMDAYAWCKTSVEARQFSTLCLDSISELAEKCLSDEKIKAKDPRQAYGEMQDKIAVQLRLFRDLPGFNVYFSAKSQLIQQPDGTVMYSPMMPGKQTGAGLAYYFDEFFYLGVADMPQLDAKGQKQQYRFLQTRGDALAEAKDRSGVLDMLEPPNLEHIFNKIRATFVAPTA